MKTYDRPSRRYWGETVPMARAAGIDPWLCVKHRGMVCKEHPAFTSEPEAYTFAPTVLEGKPVFIGDKLWSKFQNRQYVMDDKFVSDPQNWTWTPPTASCTPKKRTFMLGGREFNSPFAPCKNHKDTIHYFDVGDMRVVFDNESDRDELHDYLVDLLMQARDKE